MPEAFTREDAAVMLRAGGTETARSAMYNPVDPAFIRAGMFSGGLAQKIRTFQPMAGRRVLGAGEDPTPFPAPNVPWVPAGQGKILFR